MYQKAYGYHPLWQKSKPILIKICTYILIYITVLLSVGWTQIQKWNGKTISVSGSEIQIQVENICISPIGFGVSGNLVNETTDTAYTVSYWEDSIFSRDTIAIKSLEEWKSIGPRDLDLPFPYNFLTYIKMVNTKGDIINHKVEGG